MSSRRSSGNVVVFIGTSARLPATSRPNLAARVRSRRMRSVAWFRAVVINQARGLRGTPSRGHRSAAMANASCAASSATSQATRKPIRDEHDVLHRVLRVTTTRWSRGETNGEPRNRQVDTGILGFPFLGGRPSVDLPDVLLLMLALVVVLGAMPSSTLEVSGELR